MRVRRQSPGKTSADLTGLHMESSAEGLHISTHNRSSRISRAEQKQSPRRAPSMLVSQRCKANTVRHAFAGPCYPRRFGLRGSVVPWGSGDDARAQRRRRGGRRVRCAPLLAVAGHWPCRSGCRPFGDQSCGVSSRRSLWRSGWSDAFLALLFSRSGNPRVAALGL